MNTVLCCQIQPYFLRGLPDSRRFVVDILRIAFASRECDVTSPPVPGARRSFDEKNLRISILNPILCEKGR